MHTKQHSFSVAWGSDEQRATENHLPFKTNADAKSARDALYRELKARGLQCYRSVLKGQLRQYWGFGIPCGLTCDVYKLDVDYGY